MKKHSTALVIKDMQMMRYHIHYLHGWYWKDNRCWNNVNQLKLLNIVGRRGKWYENIGNNICKQILNSG